MEWLDIPDFPDYRLNEAADVLSLKNPNKPRILKQSGERYLQVSLRKDGETHTCKIHDLVASVYLGPKPEGMEVRHRDGVHRNNRPDNLRYGTHSRNQLDQVEHGVHYEAARTHCDNGHEFTPENTGWRKGRNGNRVRRCKRCHASWVRRWRATRSAKSGSRPSLGR